MSQPLVVLPAALERRSPRACRFAIGLAVRASGDLVEASPDDVGAAIGWGRATAYRALSELVDAGLVAREPEGLRLLWLSQNGDAEAVSFETTPPVSHETVSHISDVRLRQHHVSDETAGDVTSQSHISDVRHGAVSDETSSASHLGDTVARLAARLLRLERRVAVLEGDDARGEDLDDDDQATGRRRVEVEDLVALIAAAPEGLSRAELDPVYPVAERTLRLRLSEAVDAGLIEKRRHGKAVRYYGAGAAPDEE